MKLMKEKKLNYFNVYFIRLSLIYSFIKHPIINRENNLSPFFIIGSGRSGNTLLRRILNNHNELFIPPETYVLGRIIFLFKVYNHLQWKDLVALIYSKFELHKEFETFGIESLLELKKRMIQIPKDERSLDTLIHSFYMYYAEKHNIEKLRWGDKTPLNVFALKQINSVFPKAKYIHIVRNPYDSISSYVSAGIYDDYVKATKRWLEANSLSRKFGIRNRNYYQIFYESLVADSENEVRKVCDFLNIEYDINMLCNGKTILGDVEKRAHHKNVLTNISTESIGKGIQTLNNADKSIIDKILKRSNSKHVKYYLRQYNIN